MHKALHCSCQYTPLFRSYLTCILCRPSAGSEAIGGEILFSGRSSLGLLLILCCT